MTEPEFPWERKERVYREAREEIEEAEAVAGDQDER